MLREIKEEDLPAVLAIERLCFSMPWSEASFLSELYSPRSIGLLAETNNRIAGYICVSYFEEEAQLLDLAVHPEFRRCGVGRMLLNSVLGDVKKTGCKNIFLEVRKSNSDSIRFYEKAGFSQTGERKNYYINPVENAVIMRLEL
ncbi:MAG: ribosomal protein S18-alanine N-acetyltransferase [Nitrospirae bacterium]|nr:ribosomal protein S18-alanine N-acetyltransferase [Nitrospirota bacterium]